jgi:hypothetical protein
VEEKRMNEIQTHQESSLSFMNAFLATPKWGTFFYYAKSREELMDTYDALLDDGFQIVEQPHEIFSDAFVAKMMDDQGRGILLKSL